MDHTPMLMITEQTFDVKYQILEEAETKKKKYMIEGIYLQSSIKNRNGRVYTKDCMDQAVLEYVDQKVKTRSAYGELGHPDNLSINPERISHRILDLKETGNDWVGKSQIEDTPMGNIAKNLMEGGGRLGVSSRGVGAIRESNGIKEVFKNLRFTTAADIVIDPSAPNAFVNGILEGKEWIWDNGILKESVIDSYENAIIKAPERKTKQINVKVFEDFLNRIRQA